MTDMIVDTWLYGELARYGGSADQGSHANLQVNLPPGSTVADLLAHLQIPAELRGITFINGDLSAMPGLQPDLDHPLQSGDRVAFFHLQSMWPCQYRTGVPMIGEMSAAMVSSKDQGLHHSYGDD
jgi:sulfur carrier protein ThiS